MSVVASVDEVQTRCVEPVARDVCAAATDGTNQPERTKAALVCASSRTYGAAAGDAGLVLAGAISPSNGLRGSFSSRMAA